MNTKRNRAARESLLVPRLDSSSSKGNGNPTFEAGRPIGRRARHEQTEALKRLLDIVIAGRDGVVPEEFKGPSSKPDQAGKDK